MFNGSSAETIPTSFPNLLGYPIIKGVQIYAKLDSVDIIGRALYTKSLDLVLKGILSIDDL